MSDRGHSVRAASAALRGRGTAVVLPLLVVSAVALAVVPVAAVEPLTVVSVSSYAPTETAQSLAKHSLECLRRGEDGITRESRLAAYREGFEYAKRAVALDDRNADAHFGLFANNGRIMLLEGATPNPLNLLEANRELERALELDPDHSDALAAKGGLYRQLPWVLGGSLDKAESCLKRSIDLDPNAVGARIELAETYRDMGYPERGLPLLETAMQVAERVGKFRQLAEARQLLAQLHASGVR